MALEAFELVDGVLIRHCDGGGSRGSTNKGEARNALARAVVTPEVNVQKEARADALE